MPYCSKCCSFDCSCGIQVSNPIAFSDSITLLQDFGKLRVKVCELQNQINNIVDDSKKYTDSQITEIKNYFNKKIEEIYLVIKNLDEKYKNKFDEFELYILTKLKEFNENLSYQLDLFKSYVDETNKLNTILIEKRLNEIINLINSIIDYKINLINPWTGINDNLQNILFDNYKNQEYIFGLTCKQIQNKNKTSEWWASQPFFSRDFAYNIQDRRRFQIKSYNYVTGKINSFQETIKNIYNKFETGESCEIWKNNNLTCDEIKTQNKTCDDYAFPISSQNDGATQLWVLNKLKDYTPTSRTNGVDDKINSVIESFEEVQ